MDKTILLTAFCGTSSELLLKCVKNYETLILSNDKIKDYEKLIEVISKGKFDYIISFGQRPNIKNKVHIETSAHHHDFFISTNFNCEKLKVLFEQRHIASKISHNAGTSYCNELYLNGLRYISQHKLNTEMVFVHVPFITNIDDFSGFSKKIIDTLQELNRLHNEHKDS